MSDLPGIFESLPLFGLRVLDTRAAGDGEELTRRLRELGAEPVSLPATHIVPPDDLTPLDAVVMSIRSAPPHTPAYDWVGFTSAHGVTAFLDRLLGSGENLAGVPRAAHSGSEPGRGAEDLLAGIKLAAVGEATSAALTSYDLTPDLVPDRAAGRYLADALGDVSGLRILLPRSDVALRDLPEALRKRGALVQEVVAYATRPAPADAGVLQRMTTQPVDAVTFFSPSAVRGFAAQVAPRSPADFLAGAVVLCVGETTANAAREHGLVDPLIASEATVRGVVAALVQWRRERGAGQRG